MLSQILVSMYSQFPGLYDGMAWEMAGVGKVPEHVPYSEDFNSAQGRMDPRLVLALARSAGPLDHEHNCDREGPYGLFALPDKGLGCAPPSSQVAHVVSRLEELVARSGGSWQGAVYALTFGDDELADSFFENEWDLRAFAAEEGIPLSSLGPGADGYSALAFWYDSQIMFFGEYTAAVASTSSCSRSPRTYAGGFVHPIALPVPFPSGGSSFGMRFHPIDKDEEGNPVRKMHEGVDWGVPAGTPIHATAPGTVSWIAFAGGYGYAVEIRHDSGLSSRYAHLSAGSSPLRPGQEVSGGQVVGCAGNTGKSTGPHLHFEIRRAGVPQNPCSFGACEQ